MQQLHCKVETLPDGTITAQSVEHNLIIMPDGEGKAFNRNFIKQKAGGGPLPAMLNNLASKVARKEITEEQALDRLRKIVEPDETRERVLVGELNGVRVYIKGNNYIMTTQDLY